jgi:glycosyltransferase involved in cell wall biosynthesis
VVELDLTRHVRFHGNVDDVATWLHDIDVFVSNSYWEGQQVALMEAMASGCYCLGHAWDGIEEMLPSDNIFLTGSGLRTKLTDYALLPEGRKREEQAQMRTIAEERFDEQRMVNQIVGIVERTL